MTVRTTLISTAIVLATFAGAARAETIKPRDGGSVSLGDIAGVAYYTAEPKGYRVVVTLARTETAGAIRFETVLTNGQSVTLSTPRELGAEAQSVEIARTGEGSGDARGRGPELRRRAVKAPHDPTPPGSLGREAHDGAGDLSRVLRD
jgi:hypothetical protein